VFAASLLRVLVGEFEFEPAQRRATGVGH
jgi:hypothetical protein